MKIITLFLFVTLLIIVNHTETYSQEENSDIDAPLGLRIKRNGMDYLIYADKNFHPDFKDFRKINFQVYFRKVNQSLKEIDGKKYQLISIPGYSKTQDQRESIAGTQEKYPRSGKTVSKEDYDQNFWIDEEIIKNNTEVERYKYANDVFSGLLTAPFKYRLKRGDAPESFLDGDFNIAPFIGWKWRISSRKPFYVAPFAFSGITTLSYSSSNNSNISDATKLENGTGITYGAGISLRLGNVSPGIILGYDHGLGNLGSGFLYTDKPWISFSVNYDFFKPNKTAQGEQK